MLTFREWYNNFLETTTSPPVKVKNSRGELVDLKLWKPGEPEWYVWVPHLQDKFRVAGIEMDTSWPGEPLPMLQLMSSRGTIYDVVSPRDVIAMN